MRIFTRFLCIFLIISIIAAVIPSCTNKSEIVKEGITVEKSDAPTVTESAKEAGREVILDLINRYYKAKGTTLSEDEMHAKCDKMLAITLEASISNRKYLSVLEVLKTRGDELVKAITEKNVNLEAVINIYLDLASRATREYASATLYGFIIFAYDEQYDDNIRKYETTGKLQYNQLANDIKSKKEIFVSAIGKENCGILCELSFFMRGIFQNGALNTGVVATLHDAEMLMFIEKFDFSSLAVAPEGYTLILDYYADSVRSKASTTYLDDILYDANNNGDGARLAALMSEIIPLFTYIKDSLTKEDIRALRSDSTHAVYESIFSRFGDDEFAVLERTALAIKNSTRYDMLATKRFGEEYIIYKQTGCAKTLEELKSAIGTDTFFDTLEGYVFGISPAFSYVMNDDRA